VSLPTAVPIQPPAGARAPLGVSGARPPESRGPHWETVDTVEDTPVAALTRRFLADPRRAGSVTHLAHLDARAGSYGGWPGWADAGLLATLAGAGVTRPYRHQVAFAELAWSGRHAVVATGTASGKSLAYQLPVLCALLAEPGARALYLAPTKALAADQTRALRALAPPGVRLGGYDGDTPQEERDWARAHAALVLTNPDMLHRGILPAHARWNRLLRGLRFVVVDECHAYRGVFGSHVSQVLRRLRRICEHYGAQPVFLLASATVASPADSAARLTGLDVAEVSGDDSPRGAADVVFYEPPLSELRGENGAPARRPATLEAAGLLADLVAGGTRTLAFVRSRRGAETLAGAARDALAEIDPALAGRVAAYRAGYLPEERRALERALRSGELRGMAATSALELGVDVSGLDAVVLAGYPGTLASFWQQIGRAGRAGQPSLAVLVARDDPLDTYLVHHPQAVLGQPVEATVLDPDNPYVLAPHLECAAHEMALTDADLALFGPGAPDVVVELTAAGRLRRRPTGWFWPDATRRPDADLRGSGGTPVALVEQDTGRVLGSVDAARADSTVHPGAVYVHQGATFLVDELDLEGGVAVLHAADPPFTTVARQLTEVRLADIVEWDDRCDVGWGLAVVDVTSRTVSFLRRRCGTGEVLGEEALDLPARQLRTRGVVFTVADPLLDTLGIGPAHVPGAAHAAEHAAIGLLPLFATCDRWDVGGVSTARHPDTGLATVVVYDGAPGGAGFAERGHSRGGAWLAATAAAVSGCGCPSGCPSCVQSPKCGNGNQPLDKARAVALLTAVARRLQEGTAASDRAVEPSP